MTPRPKWSRNPSKSRPSRPGDPQGGRAALGTKLQLRNSEHRKETTELKNCKPSLTNFFFFFFFLHTHTHTHTHLFPPVMLSATGIGTSVCLCTRARACVCVCLCLCLPCVIYSFPTLSSGVIAFRVETS